MEDKQSREQTDQGETRFPAELGQPNDITKFKNLTEKGQNCKLIWQAEQVLIKEAEKGSKPALR